jgi:hypothetical protein
MRSGSIPFKVFSGTQCRFTAPESATRFGIADSGAAEFTRGAYWLERFFALIGPAGEDLCELVQDASPDRGRRRHPRRRLPIPEVGGPRRAEGSDPIPLKRPAGGAERGSSAYHSRYHLASRFGGSRDR